MKNPYKRKQSLFKALRRLWRWATCLHIDSTIYQHDGIWEWRFCRKCGRIIYCITLEEKKKKENYIDWLDR